MWTDRTVTSASSSTDAQLQRRLIVVHGADRQDQVLWISESEIVVGRDLRDGITTFADLRMSRRHARISPEGSEGDVWVHDLGAKNGTFINGVRTSSHRLVDGDVLRFGETLLVYEVDSAPPRMFGEFGQSIYLGQSTAAHTVRSEVAQAADSGMTTTLFGPTGSGKELLARIFHERTGRRGPFVPVNCAAIPRELVESTLFGHKRGAFSGATADREGYFQAAEGGTLFLDEVGELSLISQAALLRVLEDGIVVPVGATRGQKSDVRVVSATHVDLVEASERGGFRSDLRNRIGRWVVSVPPLSRRRSDILKLASTALPSRLKLGADSAEALLLASWSGNVRELLSAVQRAVTLSLESPSIELSALPPGVGERIRRRNDGEEMVRPEPQIAPKSPEGRPTREALVERLTHHAGNVAHVADELGRTRKQIYRWVEQYGIDLETFRRNPE